ncbi:Hypothetical predicted protein [Mytilus galloprovincialis]|uniref:TIR domain-containing protein n=1 Tax=Mytilus galloprovincialis TaxID=29158 RepID=A0A8B6FXM5_MYTGA|nr:Hypothetical predicted protein [Mytilus galloprovincialis]
MEIQGKVIFAVNEPVILQNDVKPCDGFESDRENELVDLSNLIVSAEESMKSIKENEAKRTETDFVTEEFQKAALSLVTKHLFVIEKISSIERSDMLKQLSKLLIDYRIVDFFCKISAELLESGERFKYPGIKPECIALLSIMLRYLGNCSNNNCELSGIIAREKYFLKRATDKLQEWKCISFGDNIDMKSVEGGNTLELLLSILYNISMVEDNVQNVRDVECIEALKPYLDSKDNTILLLCLATLANLVDETESGILNRKPDVIEFLMSTITKALKCKERMYYGWSLIKLARIVRQVVRNDSNKGTVVQHGAVPILIDTGNVEEQREAVCAVWALSFDNDNRKEMIEKKEWKVIATLERLSKSSDQTVKMVSRNAVWTIKMIKDHRNTCDLQQTVVGGRGERHIVISYNWGHQEVVEKISESLKKENIKVWMNVDNMQGCIVDAVANAIEQADIVLVCYSSKYRNSNNCRVEARYAYQLRKTIIPLKMEKGYAADSWLSFIIGSLLYYDFSEELTLEEKINKLIRAIQQKLSEQNKTNIGATQQDLSKQNKTNTEAIQQSLSERNKTNAEAIQQDLSEQNKTNTVAIQQYLSEQNKTNTVAIQQYLSEQNKTNTVAIQQYLSEQNQTNTGAMQQKLDEQNKTNTGATQQDLSEQNKTNTAATQQDLSEQNKTNTGEIHQELSEQNQTNTGEIQQELGEQNKKDTEVLQNQQPLRKNSFKPSEIPDLQTCLCYFCIRMLFLLLLIGLSCLYLSSKPASPPATPDLSGEKPKEEQTSEIYYAMNWTLLQVEEWLNDKIFQKDMFLSTQRQLKALRGKDVAFLKLLVRECPNTFYQTIREQLGMKDIQSMSDFRLALEDIGHVENGLHSSSKQIISSKTVETTKVCITV